MGKIDFSDYVNPNGTFKRDIDLEVITHNNKKYEKIIHKVKKVKK